MELHRVQTLLPLRNKILPQERHQAIRVHTLYEAEMVLVLDIFNADEVEVFIPIVEVTDLGRGNKL